MENSLQNRKMKILGQAIFFGLAFGFLLQKGGVAKYHVLESQLLLTDFTVIKIMMSAILVAMVGLYLLRKFAKIEFHIKPTRVASNIVGGLIFGIGFACAGYCPGTGAAGLGQGDVLALAFMVGMVAGSYLFAESSAILKHTLDKWGDRGRLAIHSVFHINRGPSVAIFAVAIAGGLVLLRSLGL